MKALRILMVLILTAFFFGGCSETNTEQNEAAVDEESTFEISEDSDIMLSVKSASDDSLVLGIYNNSSEPIYWGQRYVIEQSQGGSWYRLKEIELEEDEFFAWEDILYKLEGEGTTEENENWIDYYGRLSEGHYRIVKEFFTDVRQDERFGEIIYVACEFDVE